MISGRPLLLFIVVAAACGQDAEPALRVDSVRFTDETVGGHSLEARGQLADLAALGQMVAREEAADVGEPLAARALERSRLPGLPLHLAARARGFGGDQLREVYEANPELELTVRHLVRLVPRWAPAAEREAVQREVEEAHARAAAGEDFEALVAEYSEEPGAAQRGGQLDPGREGTWVDPFWQAARALEPGEVSPVVETVYGYHVLRLESRDRVPFAEANRTRLLATVISPDEALQSMEGWVAARAGALAMDLEKAAEWFPQLRVGEAPRSVVFARWSAGLEEGSDGEYTAWDAAVFRAALPGEDRDRLDAAGPAGFANRVEQDARETMLSVDALRFGVSPVERTATEATATWLARVGAWAQAFGFRAGMTDEQVAAAALRALTARGQEATLARQDLLGVRPLLRRGYRVSGRLAPPSAEEENNSSTP
jgi:hypothetical protein